MRGLLLFSTVRSSAMFLMFEYLQRMPDSIQSAIISSAMQYVENIKEEFKYMIISKNQQKLH